MRKMLRAELRCRATLAGIAVLLTATTLAASVAQAVPPLPTCTTGSLDVAVQKLVPGILPGSITPGVPGTPPFVGPQPFVSIVPATPALPASPFTFTAQTTPATPSYCQVAFVYSSGLAGPKDGYNVGAKQQIQIMIVLPLNSADGGSGGVQGNWNGDSLTSGAPGSSGSLGPAEFTEGINFEFPVYHYPIRLGYVASVTDTGQTAAGLANQGVAGSADFPLISVGPLAGTLSKGAIADWTHRGTHYGKQWADAIAKVYYGKHPTRHYYNGCSGGGNMGMGQLMHYGDEYDGMLIGAPAFYWSQFFLAYSWQPLVFKKLVQTFGASALPTTGQLAALQTSAIAACDVGGLDNVADGVVEDPRQCTFDAQANVCGEPFAPASPNCITTAQAAAVNKIWDGPHNHFGKRIWYSFDKTVLLSNSTDPVMSLNILHWDHRSNTFSENNLFLDNESIALAGNPPNAITYEDEATLSANTVSDFTDNQTVDLSLARTHGTKVVHVHGTADPAIFWRDSVNFYNRVATWDTGGVSVNDYTKLQKWYRFFALPGVGHCTEAFTPTAEGLSASDPFLSLRAWVENNQAPVLQGVTLSPAMTRPICPFPQQAIYNGSGSTASASNYFCAGSEETWAVKCNDALTKYKQENQNGLAYGAVGLTAAQCQGAPTGVDAGE